MGVQGSKEWKKLNREYKILKAKSKAGALMPKERERLAWLAERFGDAAEVERIQIEERDDGGPKRLTSDDHWATEVGEDLLDSAEQYEPQKAWEKDVAREEAKFAARDSRAGRETFRQQGLSQFAVDLTEDLRGEGFQDEPVEEDEGVEKQQQWGQVSYAKEENYQTAAPAGGANPFAVDLDPGLAGALGEFAENESAVPDTAAKSFEAEMDDEPAGEPVDFTARVDEGSDDLHQLYEQGEAVPQDEEAQSFGEMTTHSAESEEEEGLDYDLMRAAMDYAEDQGLVDEAAEVWAVDEQGEEIEAEPGEPGEPDEASFSAEIPTAFERPPPDIDPDRAMAEEEDADEPATAVDDAIGVLVPDPPEQQSAEDGAGGQEVLVPEPPEPAGETAPAGDESEGAVVPDPPAAAAEARSLDDALDVLIPDEPEDIPDDGTGDVTAVGRAPDDPADLYAEPENTATGEPATEVGLYAEPENTATGEPAEEAGFAAAQPEEADVSDLSDAVPDLSDDVPDLSGDADAGDYEVDLWVEPEEEPAAAGKGYEPPPVPDDDDGWAPEPAPMMGGGEQAAEFDLSDSGEQTGEAPAAAGDDLDAFWGLAEEPSAESAPQPAPDATALESEPVPDEPAAASPPPAQQPSRPLPALDLEAAQAPAQKPEPKPAPAPKPDGGGDRADALLSNLFGETAAAEAPAEPIIIGPAKRRGESPAQRKADVGRGVARKRATKTNDLTGARRATIHFRDGVNRRGVIHDIAVDAPSHTLHPPQGSSAPAEEINALAIKAIFLLLPRGTARPEKHGYYCKLVLIDNRQLEGYTPDYDPRQKAFTLFPAEERGNIERVIVFAEAIKNLWFPEE